MFSGAAGSTTASDGWGLRGRDGMRGGKNKPECDGYNHGGNKGPDKTSNALCMSAGRGPEQEHRAQRRHRGNPTLPEFRGFVTCFRVFT